MSEEITRQIRVYGIVQGVGFRPTVSRHAAARGIHGNVCNKGPYVEIYAQGPEEAVSGFISDIENRPPKRAAILKINVENIENSERYTQIAISGETKISPFVFSLSMISQSVRNAKRKCLIRRIGDICIRLSTAPVADRD